MIPPISTKSPVQTEAATKIQSLYRGYTARKLAKFERKVILPLSLFEQAKPLIDDESGVKKLPRAFNGGSLVFLPKKVPLVIKKLIPMLYVFPTCALLEPFANSRDTHG
jgi:hypothetical protein